MEVDSGGSKIFMNRATITQISIFHSALFSETTNTIYGGKSQELCELPILFTDFFLTIQEVLVFTITAISFFFIKKMK